MQSSNTVFRILGAVIYQSTSEDSHEDITLCKEIYERLAINFKTSLQFFKTIQEAEGEISL